MNGNVTNARLICRRTKKKRPGDYMMTSPLDVKLVKRNAVNMKDVQRYSVLITIHHLTTLAFHHEAVAGYVLACG